MSFRLADKWVWDFWFAREHDDYHLFYLQAPRALVEPGRRHHNASIGHAVSTDLSSWSVLPDALQAGPAGAWDDLATWTGSVIEHGGRWHMFYTGICRAEEGLVQRIGLATSYDLISWEKHPGPIIEADERWYALYDPADWRDQSWRDPWVFQDDHGSFHALITARARTGPVDGRGVIAHATSLDLVHWDVLPALTAPGDFAQVECPELVQVNDRYYILVSCLAEDHSRERIERLGVPGRTGTFAFSSHDLFGPYETSQYPLVPEGSAAERLYAGKLICDSSGQWWFIAFRAGGHAELTGQLDDEHFVGELTDPLPISVDANGDIQVDALWTEAAVIPER